MKRPHAATLTAGEPRREEGPWRHWLEEMKREVVSHLDAFSRRALGMTSWTEMRAWYHYGPGLPPSPRMFALRTGRLPDEARPFDIDMHARQLAYLLGRDAPETYIRLAVPRGFIDYQCRLWFIMGAVVAKRFALIRTIMYDTRDVVSAIERFGTWEEWSAWSHGRERFQDFNLALGVQLLDDENESGDRTWFMTSSLHKDDYDESTIPESERRGQAADGLDPTPRKNALPSFAVSFGDPGTKHGPCRPTRRSNGPMCARRRADPTTPTAGGRHSISGCPLEKQRWHLRMASCLGSGVT